jgi:UDP-N-acetylglucosamine 4-epimerase
MQTFTAVQEGLRGAPRSWLVTGAAGFIGSNLVEALLRLGQSVTGLDSFATGHRHNLDDVRAQVSPADWSRFRFIDGDIREAATCRAACAGVDYVLHQAALGSVPRSVKDPMTSHLSNVDGFLNVATAARDAKVKRLVYASSSSVYGDSPILPKVESTIGRPLSPYAATKYFNEVYAQVFGRCYGLNTAGLRYFNVFGPRQDPNGAYAAVIPKWFAALRTGEDVYINGDGTTSRDFCYIENVVQANILAAVTELPEATQVFNVACGDRTTLLDLFGHMRRLVAQDRPAALYAAPRFRPEREGDVKHSLADISAAVERLGYSPQVGAVTGLEKAWAWYRQPGNGS